MIEKIVSGGQTGADRGGLDAAIYAGLPYGGWCPKGRLAEDGAVPAKYDLQEMGSVDYLKRTEANVVDSDVTIVFTYGNPGGGSQRTVQFCEAYRKPCLCIDFSIHQEDAAIKYINAWVTEFSQRSSLTPQPFTLNVAGSRESMSPGIAEKVMRVMVNVLHDINGSGPIIYPQIDERIRCL